MDWFPPNLQNHKDQQRSVGIELEFASLSLDKICQCVVATLGGQVKLNTQFEAEIENTELGKFKVELDAQYLKDFAEYISNESQDSLIPTDFLQSEFITKAAEQLVPWEVVSPPIKISELEKFSGLVKALRESGALGTRHAARYAFGLHLNPELPSLSAREILAYLRAYICLYEWIAHHERIDFARKVTPYINHFDKKYIELVLANSYSPTLEELIDDYLKFNLTRNRSLDLLPLFCYLDEDRVRNKIDDPRIKPRPTLHYRLPNCDIDNTNWNIHSCWQPWLAVERLAAKPGVLNVLCEEYLEDLQRLTRTFDNRWIATASKVVEKQKQEREIDLNFAV